MITSAAAVSQKTSYGFQPETSSFRYFFIVFPLISQVSSRGHPLSPKSHHTIPDFLSICRKQRPLRINSMKLTQISNGATFFSLSWLYQKANGNPVKYSLLHNIPAAIWQGPPVFLFLFEILLSIILHTCFSLIFFPSWLHRDFFSVWPFPYHSHQTKLRYNLKNVKLLLLLSQVCAFTAQTVRKQNGWKHPAWRGTRPIVLRLEWPDAVTVLPKAEL